MLEFLNTVGGIAQAIGGYQASRKAEKYGKRALQMTPDEIRAAQLLAAYSDPDKSTLVSTRIQDAYRQAQEAMLQNITAQRLADRRAMARGQRGSFFDPERADEQIDYLTSRGAPAMMANARQNVLSNLLQEASMYNDQGAAERARLNRGQEFYTNKAAGMMSGPLQNYQFGNLLSGIAGQRPMGTTDTQRWSNYNSGNIFDYISNKSGTAQYGPITRDTLYRY